MAMSSPRLGALLAAVLTGSALLPLGCSDYDLTQFQAQDVFQQEPAGEVDVVLVVDNSCSMQPYQAKLGENFQSFLTYLEQGQVDYHIGVLTTTIDLTSTSTACSPAQTADIPAGGHLVGGEIITADTPDAEGIFEDLVNVGVCGSGSEMGMESVYRAVSPPLSVEENSTLLREDAMMSIIFVSDEEDSSPLRVADYVNYFRDLKGLEDRSAMQTSALVVQDTNECSQQQVQSGATVGTRYISAAEETDGLLGNICQDDFADILTELSYRASRLRDTFYLTKLPAPATLFVAVNDEELPCTDGAWTYQTEGEGSELVGKIVFARESLPPPDASISIIYDYGTGDPAEFCPDTASE